MLLELFSLGIAGIPLLWFCSYLSGRFQHIKVLDQLSDATACSRGVPQGSVLGPMLFVLYTRDICRILPTTVCHQEFADDIVIDISDENPTTVCNALTAAVTSLANWLHEIGLLLNSQKTQLLFMKPRTSLDFNPKVYFGADLLTVRASANYLGVVVDSDLSWDYHVAHIGRKTARTIGQLWRHGRALSLRARRTWLLSMIVSQICYGSNSFFSGLSVRLFDRVEKQFTVGVRATLQQRRLTPTAPLLDLLGIAGLRRQMQAKILVLVYRCLNNLASPLLQNLFQRTTSGHTPDRHSITRGQASNLLRIPFLHGPACHASIVFQGRLLWNSLPAEARSKRTIHTFKNYLGIFIDEHLHFHHQVKYVVDSVLRKAGTFKHGRRNLTTEARRTFYLSVCQATLDFASNAYVHCLSNQLYNRLVITSHLCMKKVFGLDRSTPTQLILSKFNLYSFEQRVNLKLYVLVYHCLTHHVSPLLTSLFL